MKVGEKCAEFLLDAYHNGEIKKISSKEIFGKWTLLFFYPRDFTFVCPTELKSLAQNQDKFESENCQIIAVSTDSAYSHKAWFERDLKDVKYPVLADTAHTLSRQFGVLIESEGTALRGAFLIDPDGILQYSAISNLNVGRNIEDLLRVLEALKTKGMCPANWKKGDKTF
jgi:alkyl hydroperoxide reductase subunit AhpC